MFSITNLLRYAASACAAATSLRACLMLEGSSPVGAAVARHEKSNKPTRSCKRKIKVIVDGLTNPRFVLVPSAVLTE